MNHKTCSNSNTCLQRMSKANEYLPTFAQGETVEVIETRLADGQTSPPDYLTESELIELMVNEGSKLVRKQTI
jgi:DNA topoisomerase IA